MNDGIKVGLAKAHLQRAVEYLASHQYVEKLEDPTAQQLAKIMWTNALNELETGAQHLGIEIMVPARGDEL